LRRYDEECATALTEAGLPLYPWVLPLEIPAADPNTHFDLPFLFADEMAEWRLVDSVHLLFTVDNLCSEDDFRIFLNGRSLADQPLRRSWGLHHGRMLGQAHTSTRPPTSGGPGLAMTLRIDLTTPETARPKPGRNLLEFCLAQRPVGLGGGARVHKLEIRVQYSPYASRL